MARHIMRRGGVFYFRRHRKIPVGTADRPFRTVLSLRTQIASIAHYRCAVVNSVYERMAMLVANETVGETLDDADVTAAVDAAVRFALAEAEKGRLRSGELTDFEVRRAIRQWEQEAQALKAQIARRSYAAATQLLPRLEKAGLLPADLPEPDRTWVKREVTKGLVSAAQENARREAGDYTTTPPVRTAATAGPPPAEEPPLTTDCAPVRNPRSADDDTVPLPAPTIESAPSARDIQRQEETTPQGTEPKTETETQPAHVNTKRPKFDPQTYQTLPVSRAMELALTRVGQSSDPARRSSRSSGVSSKTMNDYRRSARLFVDLMGDHPVNSITPEEVIEFREKLLMLPARYFHDRPFRDLSTIDECIEAADVLDRQTEAEVEQEIEDGRLSPDQRDHVFRERAVPRMKKKTVKKHFTGMNAIWANLLNQGLPEARKLFNPFSGLMPLKSEIADEMTERLKLSTETVQAIFTNDRIVAEMTQRPEDRSIEFWVLMVTCFEGMRREESAQLLLDDVTVDTAIPYLSVCKGPGKQIKTQAAERDLPIHPLLEHLGFTAYVRHMRRQGYKMVFPKLCDTRPGTRARSTARWFARILAEVGTYKHGSVMHSWRGTMSTKLTSAGVPLPTVQDILGHARDNTASIYYIEPATLDDKRDAMSRVTYGLKPAPGNRLVPDRPVGVDLRIVASNAETTC